MAWNQPGNNGQNRDPWGAAIIMAATPAATIIKGARSGAPDLDDLFRKVSKKLGGLGGGKSGGSGSGSAGTPRSSIGGKKWWGWPSRRWW
ncbi:protease modulator HflK N-terminal domain-containing protein [Edwardsiella anguillarum]|nr:protease modulator HflK N-terminal domain-containing protein [Edwardsiella anguillarum]